MVTTSFCLVCVGLSSLWLRHRPSDDRLGDIGSWGSSRVALMHGGNYEKKEGFISRARSDFGRNGDFVYSHHDEWSIFKRNDCQGSAGPYRRVALIIG